MSEKRFPASAKALREAMARGDTPRASLLTRSAGLLAGVLALGWQASALQRVFLETSWLEWPVVWWSNLTRLSWSLALICGSGALGAYLVGSLAGGFLFSAGSLRGSPGLSRLSPGASFFISLGLSLVFLGGISAGGVGAFAGLSWASAATESRLVSGFVGALYEGVVFALGFALMLGVLQAILSWYLWSQRHRRTSPQFLQDAKDEEGKARQFFSARIAEQMKRPG